MLTNGGRVLCVTALGDTVRVAQRRAYEIAEQIHFAGSQMRRDIGFRAIGAKKSTLDGSADEQSHASQGIPDRAAEIASSTHLGAVDGNAFRRDEWDRPEGGGGVSCVIEEGQCSSAAASTSRTCTGKAPAGVGHRHATRAFRTQVRGHGRLAGAASAQSLRAHGAYECALLRGPQRDGTSRSWWFGGGMDLTPYYGFEEDAIHFHRPAAMRLSAVRRQTTIRASRNGATSIFI